jgi:hypothetical protein
MIFKGRYLNFIPIIISLSYRMEKKPTSYNSLKHFYD